MKNFSNYVYILCIGMLFCVKLHAQTLSPSVLATAGANASDANYALSWTCGEAITQTFSAGNNMLSQGFQQPELQLKTGVIAGTFCPGSSVAVPFTASGNFGVTNVFTAQLSDASGSFASPVNIGTLSGNMSAGNINATIPAAMPNGSNYRIRVMSSQPQFTGTPNSSSLQIINNCSLSLHLTLFLQGYYSGSSSMTPVLENQGVGNNLSDVDSIDVELRSPLMPIFVMGSCRTVLSTNGQAICNFPVSPGNYYIAIRHRNTVQTWSALPVTLGTSPVSYNFSTAANQASGNNMVEVEPGVWAFYSGDINQDENVDLLDLSLQEVDISNFNSGYYGSDVNGDGNVDLLDSPVLESNVNAFVYSIHP